MKQAIEHVVPWVGLVRIRLFEPADRFYAFLQEIGEVDRLKRLRHLGGLARVFPGAEHTRWDYAVATLHYAERLAQLSGMRSSFKVGEAEFSACAAALQTAASCKLQAASENPASATARGFCLWGTGRSFNVPVTVSAGSG